MDFSGKVVLVTGGSRGIGAETVRKIVSLGGSAVIHYGSNQAAAQGLADEVGRDNCHLVKGELSQTGAATGIWREALDWKGRIDALVNNAGVFLEEDRKGTDDVWRDTWARTLQINLISTADLCREAINHWMDGAHGGAIVNVASRAAFRGDSPNHWSYAASKGAMVSLTKTLARAYSGNGIYTYCVAPGFVSTEMAQAEFDKDPALRAQLLKEVPCGDIAPASEIANAICFFAAGMATHASGQTLDINGASYVR
ncbi:NAD(P)-dependent dehydrogenase, short-chain alcohol dehydrogenase family [Shimia gijangensis]|uniref:NAD(P)-dependent dehydrogenase, short-chain alcohol dehydrogenase family n=1 Tax=Shimia gijangensis TaxID=1470563 RepID=A0A1M6NQD2_9RHOB|nr:SDR family oxidoreductase [Shimia gijangensis]SHJ97782.1 NAD(P)-dependent dehydrogenase, short-chain alcohol dehydrogenase family [Shimia gijangensis]